MDDETRAIVDKAAFAAFGGLVKSDDEWSPRRERFWRIFESIGCSNLLLASFAEKLDALGVSLDEGQVAIFLTKWGEMSTEEQDAILRAGQKLQSFVIRK